MSTRKRTNLLCHKVFFCAFQISFFKEGQIEIALHRLSKQYGILTVKIIPTAITMFIINLGPPSPTEIRAYDWA